MAVISMRQMLEAGVHFGHQTRRWNPKMKRFIFGERNGIYIIDLEQTLSRVEIAYDFIRDLTAKGGTVLFVGTKKQAQDPVQSYAEKVGMPYVNERWLGGMLTNFETISKRVGKMLEYERMKASGEFDAMIKKEALMLDRELAKLQRNLGGLRDMKKLPDAVFVIDTKKEHIAVTEANKLGIPVVAVVDTNVDPDVDPVPDPRQRRRDPCQRAARPRDRRGRRGGPLHRLPPPASGGRRRRGAGPPERSPEEEAAFAQAQAEARNAAAKAQADREARLTAGKKPKQPAAEERAADEPAEAAADETPEAVADETPRPSLTRARRRQRPTVADVAETPADEVADETPADEAAADEPPPTSSRTGDDA